MPHKTKAKNTPNQHDKRHENGLAPPGKRVTKQRSNGQLDGQPNGKPSPPLVLTSTGVNQGYQFPRPSEFHTSRANSNTSASLDTASASAISDHVVASGIRERVRTSSDTSLEDITPNGDMGDRLHGSSVAIAASTPPEAPSTTWKRSSTSQAIPPLSAVSSILNYYPLRDAISILILLLSLPPTLVLVIQTLFASLTFVPPTAGLSLSTLPNIKEMFNSSNLGYPALATILLVDLLFWVCWLPMWKPLQSIFLDLSHAVIAVSLSGAAAGTGGPTYSIATCTLIVCVVHVLRYRAIHLTALDYLRSVIHHMDIGIHLDVPSFATSVYSSPYAERGWPFTVCRTVLGIHIVSQGVATCIRRFLVEANERDHHIPSIVTMDAEATAGSESASHTNVGSDSFGSDNRPSNASATHRDSKVRESGGKKKRRQANQIRSRQPLWAAIASTKVTFVKEMEQRDAADDANEAIAMDNDAATAPMNTSDGSTVRVWFCDVRDSEVLFYVLLSPEAVAEASDKEDCDHMSTAIDKSKPFYVRINGAVWSSTRIRQSAASEASDKGNGERYIGEIFGLAPLSSYHCEIVSMGTQRVLCSASVITQPAPTAEQAIATPLQPQHQSLRPSSPASTLRQSIQSAENKLNDTRNRIKKTKKDHRAAQSDIRKEINTLRSKVESSGGADDKQERRLLQITQHKNQAEEATAELKSQIEALADLPSDELAASEVKRRVWLEAVNVQRAAKRDFDQAKAERDREIQSMRSEINATESKKEKLNARSIQRAQELEKLITKQQADQTAKHQRDLERTQLLHERERREAELRFHTANMDAEAQAFAQKAHDAWQQSSALSNWTAPPTVGYPGFPSPSTPEGLLPGPNGVVIPQMPLGPHQAFIPPFHGAQSSSTNHIPGVPAPGPPRGRSSSMLSQYSGFTDNDEYTSAPAVSDARQLPNWSNNNPDATWDNRKTSDGDGSGSGSGGASVSSNSPRPDANPFIPSWGKSLSSMGSHMKKAPHSPVTAHAAGAMNGNK